MSLSRLESRLEGWLSLPVRNNTKKFGWVKKVRRCCDDAMQVSTLMFITGATFLS